MDEFVKQLIAYIANLTALMLMLRWQQRRIDLILKQQHEVDTRLLTLLDKCIKPTHND